MPITTTTSRRSFPKPFGIRLCLLSAWAGVIVSGLVLLFASAGVGSYSINDRQVDSREFLQTMGADLVLSLIFFPPIIYGLTKRRPWARELIIGFLLATAILGMIQGMSSTPPPNVATNLASFLILPIALLYFYRKKNVSRYFAP